MRKVKLRVLTATLALGIAGCATHKAITPYDTAAGTLRLVDVSPAAGAAVNQETVVIARLAYKIKTFEAEQFFLVAQVETTTPGHTTDGTFPSSMLPTVTEPEGESRFSFPLSYVWGDRDVKRPITIWFLLNKRTGPGKSTAVAVAAPVQYSAQ